MRIPTRPLFAQPFAAGYQVPCQSRSAFISRLRGLVDDPDRVELAMVEFSVSATRDDEWRRREAFEGRSTQRTWLYGIARKVARDYRRKRQRGLRETPDLDELRASTDLASQSEAAEAARLVDAALEHMSDVLREVFVLVEIEQLSAPEIVEIVGVPLNTVYSRTRLARQQFRALIGPALEQKEPAR